MNDKTWTCMNCGSTGNKYPYCKECGKPRPGYETASKAMKPRTDHETESKAMVTKQKIFQQQEKARKKGRWKIIAGISLVAIILIATMVKSILTPEPVANTVQSNKVKQVSSPEKNVKSMKTKVEEVSVNSEKSKNESVKDRKVKTDLSLGGLDLGMTVEQMHKLMGKELSKKTRDGMTVYQYPDIEIGSHGNIITSLVSENGMVKTKRGVKQGDSLSVVQKYYGTDAMETEYEDMILYEYNSKDLDGRPGILRFAIKRGTNKVNYISVRIPNFKG